MSEKLATILIFGLLWIAIVADSIAQDIIKDVPFDMEHEERILALDKQAIETAYVQQIEVLFASWMKDETGQPHRAVRGAKQARQAFIRSMTTLELRERQFLEAKKRRP